MHDNAERYGLQYTSCPPYEVLFTKWISYDEILRLKQIEEMVEIYYNSCQFENTLPFLVEEFDSPFVFMRALLLIMMKRDILSRHRRESIGIMYCFILQKNTSLRRQN